MGPRMTFAIFCLLSIVCSSNTFITTSVENNTCRSIPGNHLDAALTIWEFLKVKDTIRKSDIIIGLGSHDRRVAIEASRLWLAGYADLLMFSGKSGNLTLGKWGKSEAEIFRDVAISMGVPVNKILMERNSKNTGENLKYSYELLKQNSMLPRSLIIVQKPHMGLRTVATFENQWPGIQTEVTYMVTSPNISLLDYPNHDVGDLQDVISVMIGYLQRIKVYGENGLQSYQRIPKNVWDAFIQLKSSDIYSSHLLTPGVPQGLL
ncbi:uncharacterized protein SCO4629-like [Pecten maximus]|uniref:uncharacterized protein SCO4629-like n=1 Tax=Pecten maximus TaxID=6579 RepID=UPI0014586C89|nr:uncharacterized protein SCO4629-like [Pecten maximus]